MNILNEYDFAKIINFKSSYLSFEKACGLIDQKYSLFSQKRISMIKPFSSHKIIAKTKFNI